MSVAEAFVAGSLRILGSLIAMVALYWFCTVGMREMMRNMMRANDWNDLRTRFGPLNPRRMFCRHHIASRTRGPNGLVATYCSDCGYRIGSRP